MEHHRLGAEPLNPDNHFFKKNWSLYEKILAGNFLFHREGFALLRQQLASVPGPLRLLDLGCGDARLIPGLLAELQVESYEGVDSSGQALERARVNLAGLPARLTEADLLQRVEAGGAPFSAGMASYSAHHLLPEQRPPFFARLKCLAPCWLFFDILRSDQETREQFNQNVVTRAAHDWNTLDAEEYQLVKDHILESDYPVSHAELSRLAGDNGFRLEVLWRDPMNTGGLWKLSA